MTRVGKRFCILLFLSVAFYTPLTFAASALNLPLDARLRVFEAWVMNLMEERSLPSISLAVVSGQELVYARAFGFADLEEERAATLGTPYRIASLTKVFTSIAVMQLVERGELSLSTQVAELIPELRTLRAEESWLEAITVRSLLTHTAGLPTHPAIPLNPGEVDPLEARQRLLSGLANQGLLFPPNRYSKYSNLGFDLAGLIVERTSGMPFEAYLQRFIFTPLAMDSARFPSSPRALDRPEPATGYGRQGHHGRRGDEFPEMATLLGHPAAGLMTNTHDLIQFLRWHFRALGGEDDRVLAAETLAQMQIVHFAPLPFEQGPLLSGLSTFFANAFSLGGTGLGYFRDRNLVVHSGGVWGFRSELLMNNEAKLGLVILANASDTPMGLHEPAGILRRLYGMVGGDEVPPDSLKAPQQGPSLTCTDYEGRYDDGHHWRSYIATGDGSLFLINLADEAPLESALSLTASGEDRFTAPTAQGFYAGELTVEFVRNSDGCIQALRLNRELLPRR
jgi:CubicO group peptidase (beta-lactamase class C family)